MMLHSYPVTDTRQVNGGLHTEPEFPRKFSRDLPDLISDQIRASVNRCHTGNTLIALA